MATATESLPQTTQGGAATDPAKGGDDDNSKKEGPLGAAPQPKVNVSATQNQPAFYLARARKILRLQDECTVAGLGQAIGLVVELVEILKREKVAVVKKVETSMVDGPKLRTRFRKPKIEITLGRGEYAQLVSDYRRRKVIDIFESNDKDMSGKLSKKAIQDLNLAVHFHSQEKAENVDDDEDRVAQAEAYLNKLPGNDVELPDFIRYASILIHPLLLEQHFKKAIEELTGQVDDGHDGDADPDDDQ